MAENNFLVFDEQAKTIMSDANYKIATQRLGGVTPGIADPTLHNKLYRQASIMATAVAQMVANNSYDATDEDVDTLAQNIQNAILNIIKVQFKGTIKDTTTPTDTGSIETLAGGLAAQIKAILGSSGWKDAPKASITKIVADYLTKTDAANTYVKLGAVNLWNALHSDVTIPNSTSATTADWAKLGVFSKWVSALNSFPNQPTQYGQLINLPAVLGSEGMQLWISQSTGEIYYRGGNSVSSNMNNTAFKRLANIDEVNGFVSSVAGSNATLTIGKGDGTSSSITVNNVDNANRANGAGYAELLRATYLGSGGQQAPNFCPLERVKALMSNASVNGNGDFKNWLYMDCYGGDEVGGVTAIGLNRMKAAGYIMQSDANRSAWNNVAEIITTANISSFANPIVGGNVSNANAWWVKFGGSIPLIIQGGYHQVQQTVTLPISASSATLCAVGSISQDDQEAVQTWDYTKTSFYLHQRYGSRFAYWLAICY